MAPKRSAITAKWEPVAPFRKYDNLISSPKFKHLKPFIPTYDSEKHVNMNFIMGWEYGRIWFAEKAKWDVLNYSASQGDGGDKTEFRRGFVVRSRKKKK